jgi:EmrB/QacA subfamily drug resistance transporter
MELAQRSKRLILLAAILGSGVVFLDGSVVNVALPAISQELDAGLAGQQWVVDAYLLTLSSFMLLGGSVGDLFGRRRVFEWSLAGFGVTSVLCAVAPTTELLVAARALQGIDGAFLVPSSLAIITSTFQDHERARAIGTWTAWTGVAFVIGPLLGGFLIDAASWRWVFAINVPFVIATIMILRATCPELRPETRPKVDWIGAILCALGLAGPVYGLIEEPTYRFGHPMVFVPIVAGVILLVLFILWERRSPEPMLTMDLFRNRNFSVTNVATFTIYAGLSATTFFLVLFLMQVAGYSALDAGLALLPITLLMLLLAGRFGGLADRTGPHLLMTAGPIVAAAGLFLFLLVGASPDYVTDVLPGVLVFGVGLSMTVAPLTATVLSSAPAEHAGIASGINNAISRIAALLAIAAIGAIVAGQFNAGLDRQLSGVELEPAGRAEVAELRTRPLTVSDGPAASPVPQASAAASVSAFHWGMGISAALVLLGGVICAFGIRNPGLPEPSPASAA